MRIVNRVDHLSNAVKSIGSQLFRSVGIRSPRVTALLPGVHAPRFLAELRYPFVIRDDRRHAAPMHLITGPEQVARVPCRRMTHPVAAEYVDVRDRRDGLFRKYRYIAAGDIGVPRHLIVSRSWEVRAECRIHDARTRAEEIEYLSKPDPNHVILQRARRALRLDLVAFDYSYDQQGNLVVWEANPYPNLVQPCAEVMQYAEKYVQRSYAALAEMYCRLAGFLSPSPSPSSELTPMVSTA